MLKTIPKTANLKYKKNRPVIELSFAFNKGTIDAIKGIPGSYYLKKEKKWYVPGLLVYAFIVKRLQFSFGESLREWANTEYANQRLISNGRVYLNHPIFPYQYKGIATIEAYKGRLLLADEMGLGKTVQVIGYLSLHPEFKRVLIICPTTLKLNWQRELLYWSSKKSVILSSQTAAEITERINIINYNILQHWSKELVQVEWDLIVFDEVHYIKTLGTTKKPIYRTKAALEISKNSEHIIGLSGTPIENRPRELWIPLKIINPILFPVEWSFYMRYCGPKNNGFGMTFNGASNIPELNDYLKTFVMLRRKKADVLTELPDKIIKSIYLELSNQKEYDRIETDFISYVAEKYGSKIDEALKALFALEVGSAVDVGKVSELKATIILNKSNILAKIETLKQLAVLGILDDIFTWIDDFVETGEKLIVFGIHKEVLDQLYTRYKKIAVKIDGSVSAKNRQSAVDAFQNDSGIKLFFGNMEAAGVGITLTAASNVAVIEYPWKPGILAQAIDRAHRIGQKNTVTVFQFVAAGTIMENIISILNKKMNIINSILD